jgi:hypothetical protein
MTLEKLRIIMVWIVIVIVIQKLKLKLMLDFSRTSLQEKEDQAAIIIQFNCSDAPDTTSVT